jgi:hypothetical protein
LKQVSQINHHSNQKNCIMENNPLHVPPPPPQVAIQTAPTDMYNYALGLLVGQKKNVEEVRNALLQRGLDAQSASTLLDDLQKDVRKKRKERAKWDMIYGGSFLFVGLVVTLVTLASASNGGGTYFIAWGGILFGGAQLIRGIINSRK